MHTPTNITAVHHTHSGNMWQMINSSAAVPDLDWTALCPTLWRCPPPPAPGTTELSSNGLTPKHIFSKQKILKFRKSYIPDLSIVILFHPSSSSNDDLICQMFPAHTARTISSFLWASIGISCEAKNSCKLWSLHSVMAVARIRNIILFSPYNHIVRQYLWLHL